MTVAILENRETYGERMAAYLSRHEESPFNVQLYLEHPSPVDLWGKADVILMTSSLAGIYEKSADRHKVLVLDEEGKGIEGEGMEIYKYQSAAVIYEALLEFCVDKCGKKLLWGGKARKNFMLIGIYSPVASERTMRTVLSMCRKLAADQRLLYINMEQVPVFQTILGENDRQEGVSDLIYYVKQRSRNLGIRLGMIVVKGDFDYLLPAATSAEIAELSAEDWKYCLESIENDTDYEKVVLDFGASVPPSAVLDACNGWWIVSGGSSWEQMLIHQFRTILTRLTDRDLDGKFEKISVDMARDTVMTMA